MSSSESQKSENAFDLKVKEYEALDAWTAISDVTRLPAYKWNNWMWSKIMTDSQIMHRRSVFFSTKLRQTVVLMIFGSYAKGSPFHVHGGLTYTLMDAKPKRGTDRQTEEDCGDGQTRNVGEGTE